MSRYVILTKSGMKKQINGISCTGVCVAAYSLADGKLVRFVQAPIGAPLSGTYVRGFTLLDEVEVPQSRPAPEKPQTENLMIPDSGIIRICASEMTIADIAERIGNNRKESYLSDLRPYLDSVDQYSHSIEIVRVADLTIHKPAYSSQPRASFRIENRIYRNFRVTDGSIKDQFTVATAQVLQYEEAYIVITIPNVPYDMDGHYYKFIAAIHTKPLHPEIDELPF